MRAFAVLIFFLCCTFATANEIKLSLGPTGGFIREKADGGAISLKADPTKPHRNIFTSVLPKNIILDDFPIVEVEVFSTTGVEDLVVSLYAKDGKLQFGGKVDVPIAEGWSKVAIDVSQEGWELRQKTDAQERENPPRLQFRMKSVPDTSLLIRGITMRSATASERLLIENREAIEAERERLARRWTKYLRDFYLGTVSAVVDGNEIVISGEASAPLTLHEIFPEDTSDIRVDSTKRSSIAVEGNFMLRLPRTIAEHRGRDRADSRWRLSDAYGFPASLATWPEIPRQIAEFSQLPELQPKGQKGLGGLTTSLKLEDPLFELDLKHATMNLVINTVLSDKPKPKWQPIRFEGHQYYVNRGQQKRLQAAAEKLNSQGIKISGILLVANQEGAIFTHPEAETQGIYSIPNLTTEQSTRAYRAALSVITRTFSGPQHRISNWIIHNEVDQARTWTNMGRQPIARYMETYQRSARLTYQAARRVDPFARVFPSLTHHWAGEKVTTDYPTRDFLELYNEIAEAEGDYEWGLAYHPYPRSLRNPDTWADTDVTFDFDTPYITPRNIEVLPAFLAQDRFLYRGEKRRILLSEQGFNSPTLSDEDQRRQAAGLSYMFHRLAQLPSIEAYHLHRYVDMPDREGGLRVGILDENRQRKQAFAVYQAIETDLEKQRAYQKEFEDLTGPLPQAQKIRKAKRPNIIVMLADDLGYHDTTPYQPKGENFYETPNIAALASQGRLFRNAVSASPLCSPTRASILVGQTPGRMHLTAPNCHLSKVVLETQPPRPPKKNIPLSPAPVVTRLDHSYQTLPELLNTVGYQSFYAGKWHLGHYPSSPEHHGFTNLFGGSFHPGPPGGYFAPWVTDRVPQAAAGTHIDDLMADRIAKWLLAPGRKDSPFFLHLSFYSVHGPFEAKPKLVAKYREKAKALPAAAPRRNPIMGAMIETLDDNVGKVMDALRASGLAEDTLVIFTSDNGGNEYNWVNGSLATANTPLRNGKGNIHDGGVRVPMIASFPGRIEAGVESDTLVTTTDFLPTLLSLGGAPAPTAQAVDGVIAPELIGREAKAINRDHFTHFPHSVTATGSLAACSVRRGKWKLIHFFADDPTQLKPRSVLYDISSDPGETSDLASAHPKLVKELEMAVVTHLKANGARLPVSNPRFQAQTGAVLGWAPNPQAKLQRQSGSLLIQSTGKDPFISATVTGVRRPSDADLLVQLEVDETKTSALVPAVFWSAVGDKSFSGSRRVSFQKVRAGLWQARFRCEGALDRIRLDPMARPGTAAIKGLRLIEIQKPQEDSGKTVRYWDF